MGTIFSFSNQKGGVGKTTTAVNLAAVSAINEIKTLLVDFDPQGNSTSGIGIDRKSLKSSIYDSLTGKFSGNEVIIETAVKNLFLMPSSADLAAAELELIEVEEREFVLKKILAELRNDFDIIMIDCPPSLGLLTVNALAAGEKLIIPLQCEYYALEGLGQLLNTFQLVQSKLNPQLEIGAVILTMADFRTNLTQQVIEEVRNYFGSKVFETVIPRSVKVSEAPSFGKPIVLYDPSSKGAIAYQAAGEELIQKFNLTTGGGISPRKEIVEAASGEKVTSEAEKTAQTS